jgi:hypothetical protein
VTGALTEKDVVVTHGNEALQGGEPVMVQNPPAPPATAPTVPAVSSAK